MQNNKIKMDGKTGRIEEERKRVRIFDTTLRDGEQDARSRPTRQDKIRAARVIDRLGIDVIEAGCLAQGCSAEEKEAVREIAKMKREGEIHAEVCALARAKTEDIDAVIDSGARYVHIYMGTSSIHLRSKFKGKTQQNAVHMSVEAVSYAKSRGMKVLFSAEDATRTEVTFLKTIYTAVVREGANEINIPDTLGSTDGEGIDPSGMRHIVSEVRSAIGLNIPVHVHCHDDRGLATANTLAAIKAGADCAQVTVCGIGERTGNASLEQIVASLHFHANYKGYVTGVETRQLTSVANEIAALFRFEVPENAPIIGRNAFAHKAGVHEDAVEKDPNNYEWIDPEWVGNRRRIIISRMASSRSIARIIESRGVKVSKEEFEQVMEKVRGLNGNVMDDAELCEIAVHMNGTYKVADMESV